MHEPDIETNEKIVYCICVEENNKETATPDMLNILSTVKFDKKDKIQTFSLATHAWTSIEIKEDMSKTEARKQIAKLIEQQVKFVYGIDVEVDYTGNEDTMQFVCQTIEYTHSMCDKPLQLTFEWAVLSESATALSLYWQVDTTIVE